ncbi:hypothetical protein [Salibacterium sp. K-3]
MMFGKDLFSLLFRFYKVVSFILLLLNIIFLSSPFKIEIFDSEFIPMYGGYILGLIFGILGILKKENAKYILAVGKIGLYGNLIMVILFFPPFFYYWGTAVESLFN